MPTSKSLLLAALLFLTFFVLTGCAIPSTASSTGTLRHVVLFKFKDDATPQQVKAIEDRFRALPKRIPSIIDFEWGTDVSAENKADGFTHCFLVTFADAAGRAVYLPPPAHKEFVALAGPAFDKVLVIDYFRFR